MILVFGKNGQVAMELADLAPDATFLGRDEADLTEPGKCAALITSTRPSIVINAAAYTAVDKAETDEDTALVVNGAAPTAMAKACTALGIPLVHISTDYVFDGSGNTPRPVDAPTRPLSAYGRTKLAGEVGIRRSGATHVILRTSWVFSPHGANFVKSMLRLSESRDALSIVADQVGGPTSARSIARACLGIAASLVDHPDKSGTYHFSGAPDTSWADFARAIFDLAGRDVTVTDIPTKDYPTPAQRPLNSRLDCAATQTAFSIARPDWRDELLKTLEQLDFSHEHS